MKNFDLSDKTPARKWLGLEAFVNTYSSVDKNGDQYMSVQDYKQFLAAINKKAKANSEYGINPYKGGKKHE